MRVLGQGIADGCGEGVDGCIDGGGDLVCVFADLVGCLGELQEWDVREGTVDSELLDKEEGKTHTMSRKYWSSDDMLGRQDVKFLAPEDRERCCKRSLLLCTIILSMYGVAESWKWDESLANVRHVMNPSTTHNPVNELHCLSWSPTCQALGFTKLYERRRVLSRADGYRSLVCLRISDLNKLQYHMAVDRYDATVCRFISMMF